MKIPGPSVVPVMLLLAFFALPGPGCGHSRSRALDTDGATGTDAGPGTDARTGNDGGPPPGCADPHPAWLLCEDFESGGGDFDTWFAGSDFNASDGADDRGRMDLSSEHARSGSYALYMPAAASSDYQGAELGWRKCLGDVQESPCDTMDSYEQLYFRVWVRFAEDHRYVHHFLNIAGSQPDRFWSLGSSGCMPNGALTIGATVESGRDTHESYFYSYYPGMSCDPNCADYMGLQWVQDNCQHCADIGMPTCDQGLTCCWGDTFRPDPPVAFPVGQWFCLEMTVRANDPSVPNGVMAYWINGQLGHRVDTMMWRTVPELALNRVSIQHYIPSSDADGHSNRVWFDDVVVSTEPIGCD